MWTLFLIIAVVVLWWSPSLRRSLAEVIHPGEPNWDDPTTAATGTRSPSAGTDTPSK